MTRMQGISWKRAYAGSAIVHLVIAGVVAVLLAGTAMHQEQQQMYVVDLDTGELTSSGSGHAGGGGGGSELFPEKLSEQAVAEKTAQVQTNQSPVTPTAQLSTAVVPSSDAVQTSESVSTTTTSGPVSSTETMNDSPGGSTAGSGTGEGEGVGSGSGSGSGSGIGSGSGNGIGDGIGDGQGYGNGSGDGQGSGDSGAAGTGSGAFDSDGFWAAVNANKSYPAMAVKRGVTGSVPVTVTLDGSGNCVGASAGGGPSILQNAAVKAIYAACPYPNATGQTVTIHVTVNFNLN